MRNTVKYIAEVGLSATKSNKPKLANIPLFFVFLTFILSIADLDVFLLRIPELNQLKVNEGSIAFNINPSSRGSSLILKSNGKTIELNCWITSSGMKDCITIDDRNHFIDKKAKAWWYEARINGFSSEKRLLQLEVEGNLVINYLDQKNKYLKSKSNYIYVWPMFFCVSIFFYIVVLLSNNQRKGR